MRTILSFSILLMIISIFACDRNDKEPLEETQSKRDTINGIVIPHGFHASIFADDLGSGRHIAVGPTGNVYLALRVLKNNGGIVAMKDHDSDGIADTTVYFGETLTTGMELKNGHLYYSNFNEIYRVPVTENELVPNAQPVSIITGFPEQNLHQDKTFTLDNDGYIYVNVGSATNTCQEEERQAGSAGLDPCPELERQAGIWRFSIDQLNQDQVNDGYRYASGIRNAVALDWNPVNNKLFVVQHGRDLLNRLFPELYSEEQSAELPAEEMLMVEDSDFFGWPYCYFDHLKNVKVLAPEYGGDNMATGRCEDAKDPVLAFPGHYAPNDLLFYTGDMFPKKYKEGAFIAFHGSWNRAPLEQKGYLVAFVPFKDGLPTGEWEVFADGFAGTNPIIDRSEIKHRPTGLAQGPDGSIYIVDSQKGRIWKITYSK